MQVKGIAAPVEARGPHGSAGFFLAAGDDVASFTRSTTDAASGSSAWVGLPFGREMLAGAVMVPDNDFAVSLAQLMAMDADEFRAYVLCAFLHVGGCAALMSCESQAFRSGFAADPQLAEFFQVLLARLDADFLTTPTTATVAAASVVPARPRSAA